MAASNKLIGILINIVKTGTGDKQAVSALKSVQKVTAQAAAIFGTLAAAGYTVTKMLDATVGEFMRYATSIRDMSLATGMGAEETSRFVQMLDDLRVSQEDATKVMKAMVNNGIAPTIDNLAQLSDQYLELDTDVKRSKFLLDNFGKSGFAMAEAMNAGSDAIREMQNQAASGLVLNERDLARAEELRLQLDAINDSFSGLKISAGGFLSVLGEETGTVDFLTDSFEGWSRTFKTFTQAFDLAEALQELGDTRPTLVIVRDLTRQTYGNAELLHQAFLNLEGSASGAEDALNGLGDAEAYAASEAASLAAGLSGELTQALSEYQTTIGELRWEQTDLLQQLHELEQQGQGPGSEAWEELNGKVWDNQRAQQAANAEMDEAIRKMLFQAAAAHLDAKGQLALARSMGMISEADYVVMSAVEDLAVRRDQEIALTGDAETANAKYIQSVQELYNLIKGLPPVTVITVVTNYVTNGSPPDTSGGGSTDSGGDSGCFLEGTPVWTPTGTVPIETIQPGDVVVSLDPMTRAQIHVHVTDVFHHPASTVRGGYIVLNSRLRVTGNHLIHTQRGWVSAGNLEFTDYLTTPDGFEKIQSIVYHSDEVPVYNLHTDHPTHNYIADGILVHNSKDNDGQGHAMGGIAYGPASGYQTTLHGTEAVVPLPDGRTIPVRIVDGGGMGGGTVINIQQVVVESSDTDDNVFSKMRQAGGRR